MWIFFRKYGQKVENLPRRGFPICMGEGASVPAIIGTYCLKIPTVHNSSQFSALCYLPRVEIQCLVKLEGASMCGSLLRVCVLGFRACVVWRNDGNKNQSASVGGSYVMSGTCIRRQPYLPLIGINLWNNEWNWLNYWQNKMKYVQFQIWNFGMIFKLESFLCWTDVWVGDGVGAITYI